MKTYTDRSFLSTYNLAHMNERRGVVGSCNNGYSPQLGVVYDAPMYGIELLIIGSQCNSLLRILSFWYHIVYICCTSVVPCAAMCLLAQLILLAKLCAANVPSEN